jgi:hypothetical protein
MAKVAGMDDLFGAVEQRPRPMASTRRHGPGYSEYLGEYSAMHLPPEGQHQHTPDTIRPILLDMLREARALTTMSWGPRKVRSYTAMSIYLAEWLKGGEGDALLAEFKAEMDRLNVPLDQVAPIWRRTWGLPGEQTAS